MSIFQNQNDTANKNQYDNDDAISKYRNFLSWLFQTFEQSEDEFRAKCSELLRLEPENRLLVTGCGLGQDLGHFVETVGPNGEVHAQDLSISFVKNAADYDQNKSVCFTISNALDLPYKDDYFVPFSTLEALIYSVTSREPLQRWIAFAKQEVTFCLATNQ